MSSFADGLAALRGAPPPSQGERRLSVVGASVTADIWLAAWPDPATIDQAIAKLKEVESYGWAAWDQICSGSICPPPDAIVPELMKRMGTVKQFRQGLEVVQGKGGGWANLSAPYRTAAMKLGPPVFEEAGRVVAAAKQQGSAVHKALEQFQQWGQHPAESLAKGLLVAGGVIAGAYVIKSVVELSQRRRTA